MKNFLPSRKACERLGIHRHTLNKLAKKGEINVIITPGKQRRYDVDSYLSEGEVKEKICTQICYCRVSSKKQQDDLERQVLFMREKYPKAEIVTDIGSGLNWKRKGLISLLERAVSGEQLEIVVAHRDRLARFGHELIRWLLTKQGGKLVVLDESATESADAELAKDLCAVIHVFSCRLNGRRSYKVKKDSSLSDRRTKSNL